MLSVGGVAVLARPERLDAVGEQFVEALAPCRTPGGGYRLENEFHVLVARA